MPTVQHVAKARQRYAMVPVIDPETGKQKVITTSKTTRGGRAVTRKITERDMEHPLPPRKCDYPACPVEGHVIAVGTPFKYIAIKQQYGGYEKYRHETCPSWQPHEYSSALWARVQQVQNDATVDSTTWETEEDADAARDAAAEAAGELRDEKQESLDNMPDGLRDASELNDTVENLDTWVSEIESVSWREFPEGRCSNCGGEQMECSNHEGHSEDPNDPNYCDGTEECLECHGSGEGEEVDQDELDAWREEAGQVLQDAIDSYAG